jgi:hypothetical protein
MLAALSWGRVTAAGRFFSFREVPVVPRPRTRPYPPVVVAATAELAAARGLLTGTLVRLTSSQGSQPQDFTRLEDLPLPGSLRAADTALKQALGTGLDGHQSRAGNRGHLDRRRG